MRLSRKKEIAVTITIEHLSASIASEPASHWLKRYYAARALFSLVWVALAFTIGKAQPPIGVAVARRRRPTGGEAGAPA